MRTKTTIAPFEGTGLLLGREARERFTQPVGFMPAVWQGPSAVNLGAPIWDRSDGHVAVFAPTGAGKSRNLLVPILLSTTDSAIVLDIKGELARITSRFREQMGQEVHIVDPWQCVSESGASFNPLDTVDEFSDSLSDDLYWLAGQLFDGPSLRDPYWDGRGQCVNSGLMVHALTTPGVADRSLAGVWSLAHSDDMEYELAKLLDSHPDMHPYARAQIAALLSLSANETRSCVVSTARQHLRLFASESVRRAVSTTTLNLTALREGRPQTIYFVVPPDKLASHGALLRLWLSSLMSVMTRRAKAPAAPTLLLLDEVAQLGRMNEIIQAVTLMRGYGLRCMLMLQSYAQLRALYPTEHEVLIENCGTIATFGHTSLSMSRQIASLLGDVSAEELFAMGSDQIAIRRIKQTTSIATRIDYLQDTEFAGRYDPDYRYRSQL